MHHANRSSFVFERIRRLHSSFLESGVLENFGGSRGLGSVIFLLPSYFYYKGRGALVLRTRGPVSCLYSKKNMQQIMSWVFLEMMDFGLFYLQKEA